MCYDSSKGGGRHDSSRHVFPWLLIFLPGVMRLSCTSAAHHSGFCLLAHLEHFPSIHFCPSQPTAAWSTPYKSILKVALRPQLRSANRTGKPSCKAAINLPSPDLTEERKPRLAIFVSGGGSNFRAIHTGILDGRINAEVAVSCHPSSSGCSPSNIARVLLGLLRVTALACRL